jgi:plasmid stability protein
MATLYVENVPDELYEALRERARRHRSSIAAEVIALLADNVPTAKELRRRKAAFAKALRLQSQQPVSEGPFESTEEMVRQDRMR